MNGNKFTRHTGWNRMRCLQNGPNRWEEKGNGESLRFRWAKKGNV